MQGKDIRIKLALLVNQMELPVWQYQMIERLQCLEHVQIAVVLQDTPIRKQLLIRRVFRDGLNLINLLEKKLFEWDANARKQSDIGSVFCGALRLDMSDPCVSTQFGLSNIDLVIDLRLDAQSFHYPEYCYSGSSRQIWRFFYDATGSPDLLKAGVTEFCEGKSVLNSGVLSLTENGRSVCLLWAGSGVDRPLFMQNVDQMLWKTLGFIPFLLQQCPDAESLCALRRKRSEYHDTLTHLHFSDDAKPEVVRAFPAGFYIQALFQLSLRSLFCLGKKVLNRLPGWRVKEQWILLLGGKKRFTEVSDIQGLADYKKIIPPADRFWADPFLVSREGKDYVFFEELIYSQGKGTLACMALSVQGLDVDYQPVTILDKPYHLSYPFIFEYQDELYMIPESAENLTMDIYRCTQFPHQWEWVKTVMYGVEAYDATLYEDSQGEWWMFVCMRHHEYASTNELLYLFSASNPLSDDWKPHPCNPIVTDPATARPAGNLLRYNGKLYRPSQNCAGSYGRGLNLNEVITFNHTEYTEQTSSRVIPAGYAKLDGIHTLNCLKGRVVSDGIFLRK